MIDINAIRKSQGLHKKSVPWELELSIMRQMDHPYVMRLFEIINDMSSKSEYIYLGVFNK
jgi:hypothetical protein